MQKGNGFLLIALLIIVATIRVRAAPSLVQSKATANEDLAIVSVRNTLTAEVTHPLQERETTGLSATWHRWAQLIKYSAREPRTAIILPSL